MFIKRKSTNLFKKSVTLTLMKMKNAIETAANEHTEEKPVISPKKSKRTNTNTSNSEESK